MPCLESTDRFTWIQDSSKHVFSLSLGVSEDGSELADTCLCFALGWGLNNGSVSHKDAAKGALCAHTAGQYKHHFKKNKKIIIYYQLLYDKK